MSCIVYLSNNKNTVLQLRFKLIQIFTLYGMVFSQLLFYSKTKYLIPNVLIPRSAVKTILKNKSSIQRTFKNPGQLKLLLTTFSGVEFVCIGFCVELATLSFDPIFVLYLNIFLFLFIQRETPSVVSYKL